MECEGIILQGMSRNKPMAPRKNSKLMIMETRQDEKGIYKKIKEEEWEGITYVRKNKNLGNVGNEGHVFIKSEKGTIKYVYQMGEWTNQIARRPQDSWIKYKNRAIEEQELDKLRGETIEFVPRT